ncbi:MAG: hypothetical protein WCK92_15420 [Bacteroidota bacterium]
MKATTLTILFLFLISFTNAQNNGDILTNETIIQLTKIGLQPSVIISKIRTSTNKFDVSTDALLKLGQNSVAADVITEMIKVDSEHKSEEINQKDANNPNAMHSPGIYYYNPNDPEKQLRRVDPTVVGSSETHGAHYNGIGGGGSISNITGGESKLQIEELTPTFFFYFENNSNPLMSNWFFAAATSPNEFALVKLHESKKSRSFETGRSSSGGGYSGGSSGIPEKAKIEFEYKEVALGIYSVTFKTPLKHGEYCFVYASMAPDRFSNNKVFDFGIPKPDK